MPDGPDLPPLSPPMDRVIRDLTHVACGRRLADHPGGAVALCAFPALPPAVEFLPPDADVAQRPPAGDPVVASWAKRARVAARDLAAMWDLPAGVRRDIRQTIYDALAGAHGGVPGQLERARRDGYDDAWKVVANLPPGSTAVDAARALTAAREAARG